jgi:hypothetical protein
MCIFPLLLAVFDSSTSIILDCNYSSYQDWPLKGLYACDIKNIQVTNDNEIVTGVSQNHNAGKSNFDVDVLYVKGKTLHYLPRHIEKFFPNLKGITVFTSKTKVLRRQDIAPFSRLLFVFMNEGLIEAIDGDLFDDNPTIQYVSFTLNPLTNVAPNAFDSLKQLKEIHCFQCKCYSTQNIDITQIAQIKLGFASHCLPTYEMIEKALSKERLVNGKGDLEITSQRAGNAEIEILKQTVQNLTERVSILEKKVNGIILDE